VRTFDIVSIVPFHNFKISKSEVTRARIRFELVLLVNSILNLVLTLKCNGVSIRRIQIFSIFFFLAYACLLKLAITKNSLSHVAKGTLTRLVVSWL